MLTSIKQVNAEFFKLFHKYKLYVDGKAVSVNTRYARKSSYDYVEEQPHQIFPCISIQDYAPEIHEQWYVDNVKYFGGISSREDSEGVERLYGYLYDRPIWMTFRYDVGVASKGYKTYLALQDSFTKKFVYNNSFIFNSHFTGTEDEVGDVVSYELDVIDIPRVDGVYETNYEFSLNAWLYIKEPEEVELAQHIIVDMIQGSI